jgi:hypothetical protein
MTPYLLVIPFNIHVGFFQPMFSFSSPPPINFKEKRKKITGLAGFLKKKGKLVTYGAELSQNPSSFL